MIYKPYDVVVVPFPFSDSGQTKKRPALVLSSSKKFGAKSGHSVLVMITSARNDLWTLDVLIQDLSKAGLPKPSVVRMKFFTLDNNLIIETLGSLALKDRAAVRESFKNLFEELV